MVTLMSKERGFSAIIILVILLVMATAGFFVWVQITSKTLAPASTESSDNSQQVFPDAKAPSVAAALDQGVDLAKLNKGETFYVNLSVSTPEAINLVSMKLAYPKGMVRLKEFKSLEKEVVLMWVSKKDITSKSHVELVGAIPTPGLFTNGVLVQFAKLEFEVLEPILGDTAFTPEEVKLYSNELNKEFEYVIVRGTNDVLGTESGASLSLDPASITTGPGCTVEIKVNYDSNNNKLDGIDLLLNTDPAVVSFVSAIRSGDNLKVITTKGTNPGDMRSSLLAGMLTTELATKGTMVTLKYKVLESAIDGATKISLNFDPSNPSKTTDSNIVIPGAKEILSKVSGTYLTIKKGESCANSTTASVKPNTSVAISAASIADTDSDFSIDGKVDLKDMSVLLTAFNKEKKNKKSTTEKLNGDLNKDGKVNALDYALMVRILVIKKVITSDETI